jgi:hypothetical protein
MERPKAGAAERRWVCPTQGGRRSFSSLAPYVFQLLPDVPRVSAFPFVSDLPTDPALYVLFGGTGRGRHVAYGHVAYVGISGNFRSRIRQHFNSSQVPHIALCGVSFS